MRAHADFFLTRVISSSKYPKSSSKFKKVSEWLNSGEAVLLNTTLLDYPVAIASTSQDLRSLFFRESAHFANPAFETFDIINKKWQPGYSNGLSWRLVALYYAAYYSAHSVLRMCGNSVSQINSWDRIRSDFIHIYQGTTSQYKILEGHHIIELDRNGADLQIKQADTSSKRGTHSAVWKEFKRLSDLAYSDPNLNSTNYQNAIHEYVSAINVQLIFESQSIPWPHILSHLRNYISYRIPETIWGNSQKTLGNRSLSLIDAVIRHPTYAVVISAIYDKCEFVRFTGMCMYQLRVLAHLVQIIGRAEASSSLSSLNVTWHQQIAALTR